MSQIYHLLSDALSSWGSSSWGDVRQSRVVSKRLLIAGRMGRGLIAKCDELQVCLRAIDYVLRQSQVKHVWWMIWVKCETCEVAWRTVRFYHANTRRYPNLLSSAFPGTRMSALHTLNHQQIFVPDLLYCTLSFCNGLNHDGKSFSVVLLICVSFVLLIGRSDK